MSASTQSRSCPHARREPRAAATRRARCPRTVAHWSRAPCASTTAGHMSSSGSAAGDAARGTLQLVWTADAARRLSSVIRSHPTWIARAKHLRFHDFGMSLTVAQLAAECEEKWRQISTGTEDGRAQQQATPAAPRAAPAPLKAETKTTNNSLVAGSSVPSISSAAAAASPNAEASWSSVWCDAALAKMHDMLESDLVNRWQPRELARHLRHGPYGFDGMPPRQLEDACKLKWSELKEANKAEMVHQPVEVVDRVPPPTRTSRDRSAVDDAASKKRQREDDGDESHGEQPAEPCDDDLATRLIDLCTGRLGSDPEDDLCWDDIAQNVGKTVLQCQTKYKQLRAAAKSARIEPDAQRERMRGLSAHHSFSLDSPDSQSGRPTKKQKATTAGPWPLPSPSTAARCVEGETKDGHEHALRDDAQADAAETADSIPLVTEVK